MLRVGGIGGVLGGGAALSVVDGAGVGAASVAVSSTLTGGRSAGVESGLILCTDLSRPPQ